MLSPTPSLQRKGLGCFCLAPMLQTTPAWLNVPGAIDSCWHSSWGHKSTQASTTHQSTIPGDLLLLTAGHMFNWTSSCCWLFIPPWHPVLFHSSVTCVLWAELDQHGDAKTFSEVFCLTFSYFDSHDLNLRPQVNLTQVFFVANNYSWHKSICMIKNIHPMPLCVVVLSTQQ